MRLSRAAVPSRRTVPLESGADGIKIHHVTCRSRGRHTRSPSRIASPEWAPTSDADVTRTPEAHTAM